MLKLVDKRLYSKNINYFFSELKNALSLSDYDILKKEGHQKGQFNYGQVHLSDLIRILNSYNVTLSNVVAKKVDFDAIKAQYLGLSFIPQKYTRVAAFSSRFTSRYMLDFIDRSYGQGTREHICRHFQLKYDDFLDLSEKNNIILPFDICDYTAQHLGTGIIKDMGKSSAGLFRNLDFKYRNKNVSTTRAIEYVFEDFIPSRVEKNYLWKILNVKRNSVLISGRPNDEVEDQVGSQIAMSSTLRALRTGFIEGASEVACNTRTHVTSKNINLNGKQTDLYHLKFH